MISSRNGGSVCTIELKLSALQSVGAIGLVDLELFKNNFDGLLVGFLLGILGELNVLLGSVEGSVSVYGCGIGDNDLLAFLESGHYISGENINNFGLAVSLGGLGNSVVGTLNKSFTVCNANSVVVIGQTLGHGIDHFTFEVGALAVGQGNGVGHGVANLNFVIGNFLGVGDGGVLLNYELLSIIGLQGAEGTERRGNEPITGGQVGELSLFVSGAGRGSRSKRCVLPVVDACGQCCSDSCAVGELIGIVYKPLGSVSRLCEFEADSLESVAERTPIGCVCQIVGECGRIDGCVACVLEDLVCIVGFVFICTVNIDRRCECGEVHCYCQHQCYECQS